VTTPGTRCNARSTTSAQLAQCIPLIRIDASASPGMASVFQAGADLLQGGGLKDADMASLDVEHACLMKP
jgi:hypothetical protein